MNVDAEKIVFWQQSAPDLLKRLNTSAAGLSSSEAADRLKQSGPNMLRPPRKRALFIQFLARFKNPLVIILLIASAVSAFTGDVTSFLIISAIVVMSVTLDFIQERRAGKAAYRDLCVHVPDRLGHDRRYAVDASKTKAELGWAPAQRFEAGLSDTVRWYLENRAWVESVQRKAQYERERLGLGAGKSRA